MKAKQCYEGQRLVKQCIHSNAKQMFENWYRFDVKDEKLEFMAVTKAAGNGYVLPWRLNCLCGELKKHLLRMI